MRAVVRFLIIPGVIGLISGLIAERFGIKDSEAQIALVTFASVASAFCALLIAGGHRRPLTRLTRDQRKLIDLFKVQHYRHYREEHKDRSIPPVLSYRRRKDSDTWHFCSNCSGWPTSDYVTKSSKPTLNEICNECRSKARSGNCS